MKDNRCFICKFNEEDRRKTNDDLIYNSKGQVKTIPLCYGHSVEFFKSGQNTFIKRYKWIFNGKYGIENDLDLVNFFLGAPAKQGSWY